MICIILTLLASVLVILAVLVQNPKSGMAANFGASNQVMGVRETTNFLEKFTWTVAHTKATRKYRTTPKRCRNKPSRASCLPCRRPKSPPKKFPPTQNKRTPI